MKKLLRRYKDPLIFLGLLIIVPSCIYFISMNFGDQRLHIEKKQWKPAAPSDHGFEMVLFKKAMDYIETRLPMARGMVIIRNGRTVHEKYYWKGGPQETDYLHSLNSAILHGLVGIAMEKKMLSGPDQTLADFFPDKAEADKLTVGDLLTVRVPVLWGKGPPEYWELLFSRDRVGAALHLLSSPGGRHNPAAGFAANFLLAEVIRQAASMSVFDFAEHHLFAPTGITTLAEIRKKDGLTDPFIGFKLRTLDLARFGYLVMNRGAWEGHQVIPADWAGKIIELNKGREYLGGWQPVRIGRTQCIMARGEGGQYIVLVPDLDLLIAVSSMSIFPLSENSGYNHLFGLIFEAADAELAQKALAEDPEDRPFYEPNFINSTVVPDEIRQFFLDFAKDIATQDINRILYHYAKGYETKDINIRLLDDLFLKDEDYWSRYRFWRKIFSGGSGDLEFVHIEKLRIDGNRAYLRGSLKYSYANMNEGSFGWFPLENLVKLRGRWLWLGAPEYGKILDREEYYDAEMSTELEKFITGCGTAIVMPTGINNKNCFTEDFLYNGLQQAGLRDVLQSFWKEDSGIKLHITGVEASETAAGLSGYLDNSLIGSISLPPGIQAVKKETGWKWSGNMVE